MPGCYAEEHATCSHIALQVDAKDHGADRPRPDVCRQVRTVSGREGGIAMTTTQMKPRVLLDGLTMVESPRWHDGRLWFPNWGTPEIIAVDLDGNAEVVAEGPSGLGQSIGW